MAYSKQIVIAISIGIIHLLCNVSQAATILIDGKGTEFENSRIFVKGGEFVREGDYVGNVGDYFPLTTGNHNISLTGPRDYEYSFMVIVQPGDVEIKDHKTGIYKLGEKRTYEISWQKPTISLKSKEKEIYEIKLTNPVFGKLTGISTTSAYMMSSPQRHAILNITSNPSGAEIWVDGKNSDVRTNSAVSVSFPWTWSEFELPPFFETRSEKHTATVKVVVRTTGKVNCKKEVSVWPNAKLNVHFDLLEP